MNEGHEYLPSIVIWSRIGLVRRPWHHRTRPSLSSFFILFSLFYFSCILSFLFFLCVLSAFYNRRGPLFACYSPLSFPICGSHHLYFDLVKNLRGQKKPIRLWLSSNFIRSQTLLFQHWQREDWVQDWRLRRCCQVWRCLLSGYLKL